MEEEILNIYNNLDYNNFTRDERNAFKQPKNDRSIVIKEADKGPGVVVWDREDYLTEAESQLTDPEVYEELKGDFGSPLIKTIKRYFTSVSARGYISSETLNYFMVNNPKLGRFYLLQLRYTNVFLTFPGDPLFRTAAIIPRTSQRLLTIILSRFLSVSNLILKTLIIFYKNLESFLNCRMTLFFVQ